jgi:putative tricarboxylic transport membrane protein
MPAGGAELPTLLSYYTEKKLSKHPEEFGHGAIEGVAGPEAANNAAAAGVLMPLLTLGIPTSATAAIMLSAFEGYGIQTGPQLFSQQGGLVWTLIASLYIGNVILLILNLPLVSLWVKLLKIPPPWLYAGIIVISTAGVYGAGNSVFNVGLLFVFGLLGYLMRRFDFPAAPLIVGLILAPMAEQSMRQALTISQGEWSTFFTRPLSGSLMAVAALLLIVPPLWKQWRHLQAR